jgi:hypothetical protein
MYKIVPIQVAIKPVTKPINNSFLISILVI